MSHYVNDVNVAGIINMRTLDFGAEDEGDLAGIAEDLADLFGYDDPNFDRQRFLTACGTHD